MTCYFKKAQYWLSCGYLRY